MSFVTGFRFKDFACDTARYVQNAGFDAMSLSLLTEDDYDRAGVVEVNLPVQECDNLHPWESRHPTSKRRNVERSTLFDSRMGNVDVSHESQQQCTTCTNVETKINHRCQGHFGKVSIPVTMYNPLLLRDLIRTLRSICWSCYRARIPEQALKAAMKAFQAADAGDVATAEALLEDFCNQTGAVNATQMTRTEQVWNDDQEDNLMDKEEEEVPQEEDDDVEDNTPLFQILASQRRSYKPPDVESNPHDYVKSRAIQNRMAVFNAFFGRGRRPRCSHCNVCQVKDLRTQDSIIYYSYDRMDGISPEIVQKYQEELRTFKRKLAWLEPATAQTILQNAFQGPDGEFFKIAFAHIGESACKPQGLSPAAVSSIFFLKSVLISPNSYRRFRMMSDRNAPVVDEDTTKLSSLILHCKAFEEVKPEDRINRERVFKQIQKTVNDYIMSKVGAFQKKEGLFRNNMMGKRVNQAARSVISPDGYVEVNELCIPRRFASRLTFPESLSMKSPARQQFLLKCIQNGCSAYPGASHIEIRKRDGTIETINLFGKEPNSQGSQLK